MIYSAKGGWVVVLQISQSQQPNPDLAFPSQTRHCLVALKMASPTGAKIVSVKPLVSEQEMATDTNLQLTHHASGIFRKMPMPDG